MPLINTFLLTLLLWCPSIWAEIQVLSPEQVFSVSATALSAEQLEVTWQIKDGYYLYRERTHIKSNTEAVSLGEAVFPSGEIKHDVNFGDMEIYRQSLKVQLPIKANGATSVSLALRYQGCSDQGICYPPQKMTVEVALAVAAPVVKADPLEKLLKGSKNKDDLLPPEQAFQFFATVKDANTVQLAWHIAQGYYLYREKIHLELLNAPELQLGDFSIPNGSPKEDEAFGRVEVFHDDLKFDLPLIRSKADAQTISLKASFQGCAERGVCYQPMTQTLELQLPAGLVNTQLTKVNPAPVLSEQDQIVDSLKHDSFAVVLLSFFGFGLLLSMTPCIFPMIPILSGIIVGHGNHITTFRAFLLSLSYVVASAVTYTVFGILAAVFGENLQTLFQQPWIIGLFSLVFVVLSLSMFGFYNLQLPNAIQTKLHNSSVRHQDGSLWGAAIMGALSSLIVGPCVAAPLAGALIFIGQTGDAVLGGSALFALGLGMGVPLLLLGASAGKLLPKAGEWMNTTKAVFGVVMLAVAVWMLERVLPPPLTMLLWAMLLVLPAIYLSAIDPLPAHVSGWRKLWKGVGLMMLAYGILLLIGVSMGNSNPLKPLQGIGTTTVPAAEQSMVFQRVRTVAELDAKVKQASQQGKRVMLDFYADWCVSCKEMEVYTFTDAKVKLALKDFVLLQADVTENSESDKALLNKFQLIGPPAILFFSTDQQEHSEHRIIGYQDTDTFLQSLQRVTL